MSLDKIRASLADDMHAVDKVIRARLHSDVVLIRQIADYIIGSGGKRLRPMLVVLSAGLFGYKDGKHHELAAVVELIHTATLLHDDVVDESELRRGRKTANALFGNAASVLVGDFLYSRAFQMMVGVQSMRVMEVLSETTNVIAEGEVLQLLNVHDANISEERYLQVVRFKTAKLFEAAMKLGAILGDASPAHEAAAADYGTRLGTAFQLVDDVLDYSGDFRETGKNVGDDLAEGKPTLPLLCAMQRGTREQAGVIRRAIEEGGLAELAQVVSAIRDTGALEYTRERARVEAARACEALAPIPDSSHKESLLELAKFAVNRSY